MTRQKALFELRPAQTTVRRSSMRFSYSADEIFPMFTAVREPEWEPAFRPVLLHDPDPLVPGLVFLTDSAKGRTYWVMTRYNEESRGVEYVRVTPSSDIAVIKILVSDTKDAGCEVWVEYEFTALEQPGEELVAQMTQSAYDKWIDEWQSKIEAALAE